MMFTSIYVVPFFTEVLAWALTGDVNLSGGNGARMLMFVCLTGTKND